MKYFIYLLFLVFSCNTFAQEIRPTVVVSNRSNSSYVSTIENRLKLDLERFIAQKKWSGQTRDENEKLDVRYYLSVFEQNGEQYRAVLMVEAFRPVYNATYKTPLFKIIDSDLTFTYQVNRPLIYNENQLNSNLLTNVAFYTYLALGYEGDSFELYGGSNYHQNANDLIARAQTLGAKGWEMRRSGTTKYRLVYELLSSNGKILRQWWYQYHRLGLDNQYESTSESKSMINEIIGVFSEMNKSLKNLLIYKRISESKKVEFEGFISSEE